MRQLVLGTAGHVDHGKTRLVQALTGVDTDRLAEEKARGITIDLGYARLSGVDGVRVAMVDVPGHEAFVRNMIAGATGMDAVLLVVAADEGVMPQTREHLAIVDLLGVRDGVVALSKVDLAEPEWRALVHADVREHLAGTALEGAPIVEVSAVTGEGLEALAAALAEAAARAPARPADELFRLPIDRVFTIRGTGTVVTGTVADGAVEQGATVRLLPSGLEVRVRAVESHGEAVERVEAGQRAALALAGLDRHAAERGDVVVRGRGWRAHGTWTARLRVLRETPRPLRRRDRVRVHIGTDEIMARVVPLTEDELGPGAVGWVQLRLERPGVARTGDRFILRSYSPMTTIAGGTIAEPFAPKRRRLSDAGRDRLEALLGDPEGALAARLELAGWEGVPEAEVPIAAPGARFPSDGSVARAGDRWVASAYRDDAMERIRTAIAEHHRRQPLSPGLDPSEARRALPGYAAPALADVAIARLVEEGAIEAAEGTLRSPGYVPRLDPDHAVLRERLVEAYRAGGLEPTPVNALEAGGEAAWPMVKMLEREGVLMPMGTDAYVDAAAMRDAAALVRRRLGGREGVQPAEFRDLLGLSRKHLIPLLEHFDRVGVTRREGGGRTVLPGREET
ncbi:MAG TPA: selenocysteine-specific translation elongation factor [Longimicrobiales bacterium]|nr:selenocysteine-specific translation elongation factor [Longimicrobiales bacterium]